MGNEEQEYYAIVDGKEVDVPFEHTCLNRKGRRAWHKKNKHLKYGLQDILVREKVSTANGA